MNPQFWWYLARSSGLVAAVLIVASLVLGMLLSTRVLKPMDRPAWLLAMHRWLSGLAVAATGLHLAALVADNYTHFGPREILVPMASVWKPGAVALGVFAMYLLIAVQVTSLWMKRIPKRVWRAVHLSSYIMLWLVAIHSATAGSDVSNRLYQLVALLLLVIAVTAATLRVVVGRRGAATARRQPSAP